MNPKVTATIITGFGLNCEKETAKALSMAGASVEQIHLNDLIRNPDKLLNTQILCFIGGFSFGDHLGAGTVFANRIMNHLGNSLKEYIERGNLIIGICNGFQIIARLGLVPSLNGIDFEPTIALAANDSGVFRNSWVTLRVNKQSPCIFTKDIETIPLPIRHGEGKIVALNQAVLNEIEKENLVVLNYADPVSLKPTAEFPYNPNGSINGIAGICNKTGRIFGLMPHPEAYLSAYNHPHWIRQKLNGSLQKEGMGQIVFKNAVDFATDNLL